MVGMFDAEARDEIRQRLLRAAALGCDRLWVTTGDSAVGFSKRCGFQPAGTAGDGLDVLMLASNPTPQKPFEH
jgi:hypothetical protein